MDKRATVPAPQHDYLVCIDSDGCALILWLGFAHGVSTHSFPLGTCPAMK